MSSNLDNILIKLLQKQSRDLNDKTIVEVTDDITDFSKAKNILGKFTLKGKV
jgi:hypothetical protein